MILYSLPAFYNCWHQFIDAVGYLKTLPAFYNCCGLLKITATDLKLLPPIYNCCRDFITTAAYYHEVIIGGSDFK